MSLCAVDQIREIVRGVVFALFLERDDEAGAQPQGKSGWLL
jgi:hypothetical protein